MLLSISTHTRPVSTMEEVASVTLPDAQAYQVSLRFSGDPPFEITTQFITRLEDHREALVFLPTCPQGKKTTELDTALCNYLETDFLRDVFEPNKVSRVRPEMLNFGLTTHKKRFYTQTGSGPRLEQCILQPLTIKWGERTAMGRTKDWVPSPNTLPIDLVPFNVKVGKNWVNSSGVKDWKSKVLYLPYSFSHNEETVHLRVIFSKTTLPDQRVITMLYVFLETSGGSLELVSFSLVLGPDAFLNSFFARLKAEVLDMDKQPSRTEAEGEKPKRVRAAPTGPELVDMDHPDLLPPADRYKISFRFNLEAAEGEKPRFSSFVSDVAPLILLPKCEEKSPIKDKAICEYLDGNFEKLLYVPETTARIGRPQFLDFGIFEHRSRWFTQKNAGPELEKCFLRTVTLQGNDWVVDETGDGLDLMPFGARNRFGEYVDPFKTIDWKKNLLAMTYSIPYGGEEPINLRLFPMGSSRYPIQMVYACIETAGGQLELVAIAVHLSALRPEDVFLSPDFLKKLDEEVNAKETEVRKKARAPKKAAPPPPKEKEDVGEPIPPSVLADAFLKQQNTPMGELAGRFQLALGLSAKAGERMAVMFRTWLEREWYTKNARDPTIDDLKRSFAIETATGAPWNDWAAVFLLLAVLRPATPPPRQRPSAQAEEEEEERSFTSEEEEEEQARPPRKSAKVATPPRPPLVPAPVVYEGPPAPEGPSFGFDVVPSTAESLQLPLERSLPLALDDIRQGKSAADAYNWLLVNTRGLLDDVELQGDLQQELAAAESLRNAEVGRVQRQRERDERRERERLAAEARERERLAAEARERERLAEEARQQQLREAEAARQLQAAREAAAERAALLAAAEAQRRKEREEQERTAGERQEEAIRKTSVIRPQDRVDEFLENHLTSRKRVTVWLRNLKPDAWKNDEKLTPEEVLEKLGKFLAQKPNASLEDVQKRLPFWKKWTWTTGLDQSSLEFSEAQQFFSLGCDACSKRNPKTKSSCCGEMRYCNQQCADRHWATHKGDCRINKGAKQ